MNMKWKVALLTLLGFSTAACCNTKKLGKSEDAKSDPVETETEDPRIMLMYGVPFPDGAVVHPISEEEAQKVIEQLKAEEAAKAQENK